MKNLFLSFFFLLGFCVHSQINVDSIGIYMFEMHNDMREKNGSAKRYMSKYCKQASKAHLDYLIKYGFSEGHYETKINVGGKVLNRPKDRYNFYNKDSVKLVEMGYVSYYKPYNYKSEICNYQYMNIDSNDKNINKVIAKILLESYVISKNHNYQLINNTFDENIVRGFFSVGYKIENSMYVFYSVGVFDTSLSFKEKLESTYKKGYEVIY